MANLNIAQNDEQEAVIVKKDLKFVITLNLILAAALIGLYFANRSTGKVDQFFATILKF
jgi:hypothetical protein